MSRFDKDKYKAHEWAKKLIKHRTDWVVLDMEVRFVG